MNKVFPTSNETTPVSSSLQRSSTRMSLFSMPPDPTCLPHVRYEPSNLMALSVWHIRPIKTRSTTQPTQINFTLATIGIACHLGVFPSLDGDFAAVFTSLGVHSHATKIINQTRHGILSTSVVWILTHLEWRYSHHCWQCSS